MKNLESYVRSIPDFPEPGIIFRDVTSILQDKDGLKMAIDQMQQLLDGLDFDIIVGPESRGFIFGVPIAYNLNKAFIPIRKKGKLPCKTISMDYDLEYGKDRVEIHIDALEKGERVLLVDDLIATGGTAFAGIKLLERAGAQVIGCSFVIDLPELGGADKLRAIGKPVTALVAFEGH
jgi:adenine phosphoribosyltransferase